jgi:pimeloyl-ACP methyl ester carboxylesterase
MFRNVMQRQGADALSSGRARIGVRVLLAAVVAAAMGESPLDAGTGDASRDAPPAIVWKKLGAASGRPIIFLPALGMPGRYWSKIWEQFEKDHPIYVVTYAGTDGIPPTKPPYLKRTVEEVHRLIESEKLQGPVLVGHLYGAYVALHVAGEYPDSVGGVFAQPVVWGRKTIEERRKDAEEQAARYRDCTPEVWIPTVTVDINSVIEDANVAKEIASMVKSADQETFAGSMYEMFADEIEPWLEKIKVPVFLISPVFVTARRLEIDTSYERMSSLVAKRRDMMYEQFPNIARCDTFLTRDSLFFPMLEAPGRLGFSLGRYIKRLDDPKSVWDSTVTTHPAGHDAE